ncbi:LuxR C-terminal-related transcriptional regulator [Novispirillum sp. DQ9]|uniref:LuxR C-terminal-related transcriptional regulator n=1 Tax=Novispirillum sp. DQ9 TaxID=3398612 RepID=UPI003C7E9897
MRTGRQEAAGASASASTEDDIAGMEAALSPRQRQILDLLRQGKANKEIATQLGIGVGTVKQHVVALYKKLNVSNRAMAVSRGIGLDGAAARADAAALDLAPGCVLERRLSVILTIEDGRAGEPRDLLSIGGGRLLRRTAAALAQDYDAVLVTRGDAAVDFVFGVHAVRDDDAQRALRAAHDMVSEIASHDPEMAARLRGALSAGLSMTSMTPTGGWTGELLASAALGQARDLAATAAAGELAVGAAALDLLDGARRPDAGAVGRLRLCDLGRSLRRERAAPAGVIGRAAELRVLEDRVAALAGGRGGLLVLSGDGGMGKTLLADALAARARAAGVPVRPWTVLPADLPGAEEGLAVGPDGRDWPVLAVDIPAGAATIVDDAHHLRPDAVQALADAWRAEGRRGLLVFCGRPGAALAALPEDAAVVRVAHLDGPAMRALVDAFGLRAEAAVGVLDLAGGVPLFAVELARAAHAGQPLVPPPPGLMAVIQGRIGRFRLDRRILAKVCRTPMGVLPAEAVAGLPEADAAQALARVEASGVARRDDSGRLRVPHPLLRAVLDAVLVE